MKFIGKDMGYDAIKVVVDGHKFKFDNIVGPAGDTEKIMFSANGDEYADPLVIHIAGLGDRMLGEDVYVLSGYEPSRDMSPDWITNENYKFLLTAALLKCGSGSFQANVVSGLPVNYFQTQRHILRNLLLKTHEGTIKQGDKPRKQTVQVGQADVIPQPMGSFFNVALKTTGELVDDMYAYGSLGVIDMGGGTTNYSTVRKRQLISTENHSIMIGGRRIFKRLADYILHNISNQIKTDDARMKRIIENRGDRFGGRWIDLGQQVDEAVDMVYKEIITNARNLWGDGLNLDQIIITGGGARLVGERLWNEWNHARYGSDNPDDLVYANALGYYKYAKAKFS